jgi:hypothetical protein
MKPNCRDKAVQAIVGREERTLQAGQSPSIAAKQRPLAAWLDGWWMGYIIGQM